MSVENSKKCSFCDVPLVFEMNTDTKCNGCCFECYKQKKIEVMIYAFGNLPIFFNVKDDILRMKPAKFT
jgi:hypothetical protein